VAFHFMTPARACPQCGAELPADALQGLCPKCMGQVLFGLTAEAPTAISLSEQPGDRIGHYKLLQQIGEGGCGVVYLTEQEEPIHRRVALKVIKLGMDTKEVVARFEAERQALALMDHPNIAKVFDAGVTNLGRPYFVMELVRGTKITDYCDQNHLSTDERLKLFTQVCHAIQHAHQKGVIHRDIKPSNILVSLHDDVPVPKVIDFGIAKAIGERLTDKTVFTRFEQFIGTPAYMSPEQAGMSGLDIDTRSDIYALGVLLYELLTGRTPFDAKQLAQAGLEEILRRIREEEPPRPSTRLRTLQDEELTTTAQRRQTEPPKLIGLLRGDLDWIVMKCLEKNRAQRYETANNLAADVERHLRQEPVTAVAPTVGYRLAKFSRRHRTALAVASAFALLLLVASAVSTWQAVRATRNAREAARQAARADRHAREQARQRDLADAARAELAVSLERMELQRAEALFLAGDSATAVAGLARIVRRSPTNRVAAERLLSALTYRTFVQPLTPPLQHERGLYDAEFSQDGRYVVTACGDKSARMWDAQTGQLLRAFQEEAALTEAQFSRDGLRILTACAAKARVRIWDSTTGQLLQEFNHPDPLVFAAALSPDGRRGVSVGSSGRAILWDATTGVPVLTNVPPAGPITGGSFPKFSPDGRWALVCGGGRLGQVWELDTGRIRAELTGHEDRITAAEFSPDGEHIVTGSLDGTARIWQAATGDLVHSLNHNFRVYRARYSPDGRRLVTVSTGDLVSVWDVHTGKLLHSLHHKAMVRWAEFSPDGLHLVTGVFDGTVHLWDSNTGLPVCEPFRHQSSLVTVRFSSDGRKLLTSSTDGTARIWSTSLGRAWPQALWEWKSLPYNCLVATFSPDGQRLVTTIGLQAYLRDARTGRSLLNPPLQHGGLVTSASFSADGQRVVTGSVDGAARIWEVTSGRLLVGPLIHTGQVMFAQFSPNGHRVVTSADAENSARVWDANSGQLRRQFQHADRVGWAEFSPDNQWLITASADKMAHLWDTETGERIRTWKHPASVNCAHFSHDGQTLVTTCDDKNARLWSSATGQALTEPLHHAGTVGDAQFSRDDRLLVTVSADRTARIWEATTGKPVTGPLQHRAEVIDAQFSPDGHRVATASTDATVQLWDSLTGLPLGEALEHGGQVDTTCFSPDGQRLLSSCWDGAARLWEVPTVPTPVPNWFPRLAEAIAEVRVGEQGAAEAVPFSELETLRRELTTPGGSDFWARWAEWFFLDPTNRCLSPFSSLRMADYVRQRIDEDVPQSLREAVRLAPGNAMAWARLARAVLRNDSPNLSQRMAEADAYSQYAIRLGSTDPEALWARADLLDRQERLPETLELLQRLTEQRPVNAAYWLWAGGVREKANDFEEAYAAYTKAIEFASAGDPLQSKTHTQALQSRGALLKRQGRLGEALADSLSAMGIPPRDPGMPPNLIDLAAYYNASLLRGWSPGNYLTDLPPGKQRLGAVEFDVRGLIKLARNQAEKEQSPEMVEGIKVGRLCRQLHFLHATTWQLADHTPIGDYVIHYRDGGILKFPIVYGDHVRNWWVKNDPKRELAQGVEVWTGRNPFVGEIRLFKSTWDNPRPHEEIATIDFVSLMKEAGPFLVAITADP
jgi:eukaryotic-like serine/threonine-protein kinase